MEYYDWEREHHSHWIDLMDEHVIVKQQMEKIHGKMNRLGKDHVEMFVKHVCFRYVWAHNLRHLTSDIMELDLGNGYREWFKLSRYKTFAGLVRAVNKAWKDHNDEKR